MAARASAGTAPNGVQIARTSSRSSLRLARGAARILKLGHCQHGQSTLEGCGAGIGQCQRFPQVLLGLGETTRLGRELAEEAVRGQVAPAVAADQLARASAASACSRAELESPVER